MPNFWERESGIEPRKKSKKIQRRSTLNKTLDKAILALLKQHGPRSYTHICYGFMFTPEFIQKTLDEMEESGLIIKNADGLYAVGESEVGHA